MESNEQKNAHMAVYKAIKDGILVRSKNCQVCGRDPSQPTELEELFGIVRSARGKMTVGHHWNGYNNPLDVWWVCYSCNTCLIKHDGSVTLEQAQEARKNKWADTPEQIKQYMMILGGQIDRKIYG